MSLLSRYFHTVRYLKPGQIYRRFWFRVKKVRPDHSAAAATRNPCEAFHSPACRRVSLLDADTFIFLNQRGSVTSLGWDFLGENDSVSKLWRYNQHYFDDLNAENSSVRSEWHSALLERWLMANKPGSSVGWDPYPTSLRIVNWIKWHLTGNTLTDECLQSLAIQVRWLKQRIEWHILGNHLFANAKALVFAGLFFSGDEAEDWLQLGLNIIGHELPEQVLADGGHFERSTMYHSLFLEDLLDLINIVQVYSSEEVLANTAHWREAAQRMLLWMKRMSHPDGEIAFFNDAAIGIAPRPQDLIAYACRLGVQASLTDARVAHMSNSGYVRLVSNDALVLIDAAPIGPDYLPGHAHADTLSFELSLFGRRIFVNCGTSEYKTGSIRHSERSTAAHNTVVVNDKNSSEVWGGFRVARRAYPKDLMVEEGVNGVFVSCMHDGYRWLPAKLVHRRTWEFSDSSLIVSDYVDGDFESAVAYFHLHPEISFCGNHANGWQLQLSDNQKVLVTVETGNAQWSHSYYSPEFGLRVKTLCLKIFLGEDGARLRINWSAIE